MSLKQVLSTLILSVSVVAAAQAQQTPASTPPAPAATAAPAVPAAQTPDQPAQAPAAAADPAPTDASQEPTAPEPEPGGINGTVTDLNGDPIPGATITLSGVTPAIQRTAKANQDGFFDLNDLAPGTYHIAITMKDFTDWKSDNIVVKPGQDLDIPDIKMAVGASYSVTALYSPVQIATQEVHVEEQQRVLGVIPNFYVVYDSSGVPLTAKLKFQLAFKSTIDPATFVAANVYAAMNQVAVRPGYTPRAVGYAQRLGAIYADGFTDILFGGAVLPSLLHQDPRYFYDGPEKGNKMHRFWYAVATPFICKGDSGKWEPNFSSIGGDLISGAMSNLYYPQVDRGVGLVFTTAALGAGGRMVNALAQEFLLRKLTTTHTKKNKGN